MSIVVNEVLTSKELKDFISFPNSLYDGNAYWLPPLFSDEHATLSRDRNPAFENCEARYWLAYDEGKIVGRIAGIINNAFIEKWKRRYIRFGWIDFVNDPEVSRALLAAVESWGQERGMEAVHGPFGFTDFDPEGMLVDGFDKLSTMTTIYNYPYYPRHLETLRYNKDAEWLEYEVEIPQTISERVRQIAERSAGKLGLRLLKARSARDLIPYVRGVFDLINVCYAHLYGVVTLTPKQVKVYTDQFFQFIDPDYVSIVLKDEEVVAFAVTIPSLSKALQKAGGKLFPFGFFHLYKALHWNHAVDLYLIAVRPDLQNKGVTSLLIKDLNEKFIRNKIYKATTHPILEQNGKMVAFWKGYKKTVVRRRRCYIKNLLNG